MTALSLTLNKKLKIQVRSVARDAAGQPLPKSDPSNWTNVAEPWGNIRHLNGTEAMKAGAEKSIESASIRIRYRLGLTTAMRVLHRTTVYEIKAVLPDETSMRYIDLVCEVIK